MRFSASLLDSRMPDSAITTGSCERRFDLTTGEREEWARWLEELCIAQEEDDILEQPWRSSPSRAGKIPVDRDGKGPPFETCL